MFYFEYPQKRPKIHKKYLRNCRYKTERENRINCNHITYKIYTKTITI